MVLEFRLPALGGGRCSAVWLGPVPLLLLVLLPRATHSTAGPQAWGFSEPFRSLGAALSVLSTSQALLGSVELGFPAEI